MTPHQGVIAIRGLAVVTGLIVLSCVVLGASPFLGVVGIMICCAMGLCAKE